MAILKAARQLAVEANVHVHIRKFSASQISHRACTPLVHSMLNPSAPSRFAQVINQARLRNLITHVITSGPQGLRHTFTSTALLFGTQNQISTRKITQRDCVKLNSSAKLNQLAAGAILQIAIVHL